MLKKLSFFVVGAVGAGTEFDYCSIQHSAQVEEDVRAYFLQVFKEFEMPVSESCPFSQLDLISQIYNIDTYKKRKPVSQMKTECPICGK